ncbi:efflux RND transporter periplasmic adaptor subunit [Shewanella halifaxensis]|uniref:efflux RND transporter periplasmic adaptor subunit n=1 Tax=Shewanella halifaxensis TaxID=271098 RepID=UPI000D596709|nr:efflux RND transporter periplasmic adaptor subunit [Shewanella halifaxensis]
MLKQKNKKAVIGLFLGTLLTTQLSAASSLAAETIESIQIKPRSIATRVTLDAYIEPVKAATVSAQTSGRIIKLNYDINDVVDSGSPLLEITNIEQGAQLSAANAEYAKAQAINIEAQRQLTRYQTLFPQGAISQGAMDEALANAKAAEQQLSAANAKVAQAKESVKYTVVNAPFSGVVTQRHVEEGETVSPGQALYSGYSLSQMRAVTHIPQRYVAAVKRQPQFRLILATGEQIESDELTLFSFIDPNTHSYKVRINLPQNQTDVIPGSLIKAQFVSDNRTAIYIPKSSIMTMNALDAVYLKQDNNWVLTQVRVGSSDNGQIEILAGLSTADVIAKDAYQALQTLNNHH